MKEASSVKVLDARKVRCEGGVEIWGVREWV